MRRWIVRLYLCEYSLLQNAHWCPLRVPLQLCLQGFDPVVLCNVSQDCLQIWLDVQSPSSSLCFMPSSSFCMSSDVEETLASVDSGDIGAAPGTSSSITTAFSRQGLVPGQTVASCSLETDDGRL